MEKCACPNRKEFRAVTFCEYDYNSENTADIDLTTKTILGQKIPFDDIVNRKGISYFDERKNEKKYFYSKSSFWRLIKKILEASGTSEKDNWYDDKEEWNQQIAWSNLYKIAPRKKGNPSHKLMAENMREHIDIIKKEIELYRPGKILFVTDDGYYLEPESGKQASFISEFGLKKVSESDRNEFVKMTGTFGNAKIVVSVRPERKNTSVMANEIIGRF